LLELHTRLRRALRVRTLRTLLGPRPPLAQIELLRHIAMNPGTPMKGAAAALSLAPNTVSTLARNLLRAGLIERRTNPTDSRSALLYLSLAGRRRLRAWRDAREAILAEALERLPENQRNQLERSLRALESLVQEVEA